MPGGSQGYGTRMFDVAAQEIRYREYPVSITSSVQLTADLWSPPAPRGLVVFVHGSGSSRFSPRNQRVADLLHPAGFGTLLVDLLTIEEVKDPRARFEIESRGDRVAAIVDHLVDDPAITEPVALFGASTGAAAAIAAAASRPAAVATVVSRGGRPDLAGCAVETVSTPTLLVVGSADERVLELNRSVLPFLPEGSALEIVPGATHLFEEPGAIDAVAELTRAWLVHHLHDPAMA